LHDVAEFAGQQSRDRRERFAGQDAGASRGCRAFRGKLPLRRSAKERAATFCPSDRSLPVAALRSVPTVAVCK